MISTIHSRFRCLQFRVLSESVQASQLEVVIFLVYISCGCLQRSQLDFH